MRFSGVGFRYSFLLLCLGLVFVLAACPSIVGPAPGTRISPLPTPDGALTVYRGPGLTGGAPDFEITYSPQRWQFSAQDATYGVPVLRHTLLPNCTLLIGQEEREGARPRGHTTLDEIEWAVFENTALPHLIAYRLSTDGGTYVLALANRDAYSSAGKRLCQLEAEGVLRTFAIVEE